MRFNYKMDIDNEDFTGLDAMMQEELGFQRDLVSELDC